MDAAIYNKEVKEVGQIGLPEDLFKVELNEKLIAEVLNSMARNARIRTANTKTRGEVAGGGRKPWRQKGTGRARHGSIRSPIWKGGGVTFGPRIDIVDARKINKKVKTKVFRMTLSEKFKENEIIFLEGSVKEVLNKTKEAQKFIDEISKALFKDVKKTGNKILFITPTHNGITTRGIQNIQGVKTESASDVSIKQLIDYQYVLVLNPEESIKSWVNRVSKNKVPTDKK